MKYSREELAAMARTMIDAQPCRENNYNFVEAGKAKHVVLRLAARFGCCESIVFSKIQQLAKLSNQTSTRA